MFLSVDLRVKRFNLTILIQNVVQILAIFHNIIFFYVPTFFSLKFNLPCLIICLSDISLAKNNLNNLSIQHIKKKNSKTMNYLIILIKFKVSRFLCRSVYYKGCRNY
jgi:hypothetical protein